jgi:hypothetical protein
LADREAAVRRSNRARAVAAAYQADLEGAFLHRTGGEPRLDASVQTLYDGTVVVLGPSPEIAQWERNIAARMQTTTALSTRALRRKLERQLRRLNRRDGKSANKVMR